MADRVWAPRESAAGHVTCIGVDYIVCLRRSIAVEQTLVTRERLGEGFPGDLQLSRGADRIPLVRRDHAYEVAPPDDLHPGDSFDRRFVNGGDRRIADGMRSLATRPDDPPVKHSGEAHMLDVLIGPIDLRGDIGALNARAHDAVVVPPLGGGIIETFTRELDPALV